MKEAKKADDAPGKSPTLPRGSCDCHVHVFGDERRFPLAPTASYRPAPSSLDELRGMHRALGVERVVLIQPSVYGTDNRSLVNTLRELGPTARGVAVIDPGADEAELLSLHDAGVRGVRLNLAAGAIENLSALRDQLRRTAERIQGLGWHVQIFASSRVVAAILDVVPGLLVPVVFDHFARGPDGTDDPIVLERLPELLRNGHAYVKLSAPYFVSRTEDRSDLLRLAGLYVSAGPGRILWGSNWPHVAGGVGTAVSGTVDRLPIDERLELSILRSGFKDVGDFALAMSANAVSLYGFDPDHPNMISDAEAVPPGATNS